jgi:hypothetical protein
MSQKRDGTTIFLDADGLDALDETRCGVFYGYRSPSAIFNRRHSFKEKEWWTRSHLPEYQVPEHHVVLVDTLVFAQILTLYSYLKSISQPGLIDLTKCIPPR